MRMKENMKIYNSYCFIDSTILLHFKLFTEIDWNKLTKCDSTLLVICPAVMKELDLKKDLSYDINLRHRARMVISKISEILNNKLTGSISKNIDLTFLTDEPTINWSKEHLDPEISDDRIIASILIQKDKYKNIILAANDTGLKLKANAREINCILIPDEYRLSDKKDKIEIGNEQLKNRIAFLENSLPSLKLKVLDADQPSDFVKYKLTPYIAPTDAELNERLNILKNELDYQPPPTAFGGFIGLFHNASETEIERYKKDLGEYIKKMPAYFKNEIAFKEYHSRLVQLRFVIINTGNKPADDINIFIKFPDGFEALSEDELLENPDEPEKPMPPQSLHETLYGYRNFNIPDLKPLLTHNYPNINTNLPSGPHIKKTNSYDVNFDIPKLKHGLMFELDSIYILFESIKQSKSFQVTYSILADNIPDPTEGALNIVIYN